MNDFFYMGGFGVYIWSAMATALVLMLIEPIILVMKRRTVLADIKRIKRIKRLEARKNRK